MSTQGPASTPGPAPRSSEYVPAHAAREEPEPDDPSPAPRADDQGAESIEPVTPAGVGAAGAVGRSGVRGSASWSRWYSVRTFRPGRGRIPPAPLPPVAPPPPPPPLKPRPYASPPVPKRSSEWHVLIVALFVSAILLLFFCVAGFAIYSGGGIPGTGR